MTRGGGAFRSRNSGLRRHLHIDLHRHATLDHHCGENGGRVVLSERINLGINQVLRLNQAEGSESRMVAHPFLSCFTVSSFEGFHALLRPYHSNRFVG